MYCHWRNFVLLSVSADKKIITMGKDAPKLSMPETISRQALGRIARLGDLYDATTDKFCGVSVLRQQLPPDCTAISKIDNPQSNISFTTVHNLREKCKNLNITGELQLSVLAGLVELGGSAKYLSKEKESFKSVEITLIYNIKTKTEHLEFSYDQVQEYISKETTRYPRATYIVIGIEWGASCVMAITDLNKEDRKKQEVEGDLTAQVDLIKSFLQVKGKAGADYKRTETDKLGLKKFSLKIFGDVLPDSSDELPLTTKGALTLMRKLPQLIRKYNHGKGKPLTYIMIPLSYVASREPVQTPVRSADETQAIQVVHLVDYITQLRQRVHDQTVELNNDSYCVPSSELEAASHLQNRLEVHQARVKREFAQLLEKIRSLEEAEGCLDIFCEKHLKTAKEIFCECKKIYEAIQTRIIFVKRCEKFGAEYLAPPVDQRIASACDDYDNVYVLFHGQADTEITTKNESVFIELAKENHKESKTVCYFTWSKPSSEGVVIKHFKSGKLIDDDVAKQLETKHMAMFVPAARRAFSLMPFKVRCPVSYDGECSKEELSWTCSKCSETLQFCPYDYEVYCNCGQASVNRLQFRCNSDAHGSDFAQFNDDILQTVLDRHVSSMFKGNYFVKLIINEIYGSQYFTLVAL